MCLNDWTNKQTCKEKLSGRRGSRSRSDPLHAANVVLVGASRRRAKGAWHGKGLLLLLMLLRHRALAKCGCGLAGSDGSVRDH